MKSNRNNFEDSLEEIYIAGNLNKDRGGKTNKQTN